MEERKVQIVRTSSTSSILEVRDATIQEIKAAAHDVREQQRCCLITTRTYHHRVLNSLRLHPLDPIALKLFVRDAMPLDDELHLPADDTNGYNGCTSVTNSATV